MTCASRAWVPTEEKPVVNADVRAYRERARAGMRVPPEHLLDRGDGRRHV
jgi:hypothetical protein